MGSDLVCQILTGNEFHTLGAENRKARINDMSVCMTMWSDKLLLSCMCDALTADNWVVYAQGSPKNSGLFSSFITFLDARVERK